MDKSYFLCQWLCKSYPLRTRFNPEPTQKWCAGRGFNDCEVATFGVETFFFRRDLFVASCNPIFTCCTPMFAAYFFMLGQDISPFCRSDSLQYSVTVTCRHGSQALASSHFQYEGKVAECCARTKSWRFGALPRGHWGAGPWPVWNASFGMFMFVHVLGCECPYVSIKTQFSRSTSSNEHTICHVICNCFCSFWTLVRGVTKDRCHLLLRLFGEQLGRPGPRGCFAATDPVGEVRDLPGRRWKHHGGGGHAGLEETHGHSGTVSGQNGRWPKCGSLVTTKCGQGLLSPSVTETKLPGLFLRSNKNILKKNMDLVAESGCRSMRMQPQTVGSCKKKHGPMVLDLEVCNSCGSFGFFWRGARGLGHEASIFGSWSTPQSIGS